MTYQRLAYDEASTPSEMATDCRAVDLALQLPRQAGRAGLVQPPAQQPRLSLTVTDAAARLAATFSD